MKKIFFLLLSACLLQLPALAQYWQQEVNYKINVTLDDKKHVLKGMEELEYVNNSPDQLDYIIFHVWLNGYRNDNTAFAKQLSRDEKGQKTLKAFKDRGFTDSLDFKVDGVPASFTLEDGNIDVLRLKLPKPLAPGGRCTITTPFYADLPEYISRSGHKGNSYIVCQWYPKPAVYDRKGWHTLPYLDQGEFYSEFGRFEVTLNLPSNYIVGATGVLQNSDELAQYKAMGTANRSANSRKNVTPYKAPATPMKSLTYKGENIPDFAWFADKDFVVRYDTMQLGGRSIDVFTYHHPNGNKNWVNSTDYVKSGTAAYSSFLGEYPYPVVQAVEGPKNESSGGMEYPMVTLITSPDASVEQLDAVITHEVGHNWFMCILGSNERQHAWLDEGLNSYFQFRYEAEKYRYNSIFGDAIPANLRKLSTEEFQGAVYRVMNENLPMEEMIDIPSTEFATEESYGIITYIKTAVWLYFIEMSLGRDKLDKAFQTYYSQWKFKHPYPEDFKAAMDKEFGKDTQPYFDMLKKKGKF